MFLIAESLGMGIADVLRMSILEYRLWMVRFSEKLPMQELVRAVMMGLSGERDEDVTETYDEMVKKAVG